MTPEEILARAEEATAALTSVRDQIPAEVYTILGSALVDLATAAIPVTRRGRPSKYTGDIHADVIEVVADLSTGHRRESGAKWADEVEIKRRLRNRYRAADVRAALFDLAHRDVLEGTQEHLTFEERTVNIWNFTTGSRP